MPSMKCSECKRVAKCSAVAERGEGDRVMLTYYCAPCKRELEKFGHQNESGGCINCGRYDDRDEGGEG